MGPHMVKTERFNKIYLSKNCLHIEKRKSPDQKGFNTVELQSHPQRPLDEKVKEMKDKVIRAKAYLSFAHHQVTFSFCEKIKLRIKELERAEFDVTKDSGLSRRAIQKMKAMDGTLLKSQQNIP
ncbi:hypothetical protein HAX54_038564 [Datura stramonium]|uniref:Uncharacterized protein n=1 Tax=Datura stramonium TaxID=4076 RepID=A0ABS8SI30_DATST|nr:hypothetical protein [Datura stramonium]